MLASAGACSALPPHHSVQYLQSAPMFRTCFAKCNLEACTPIMWGRVPPEALLPLLRAAAALLPAAATGPRKVAARPRSQTFAAMSPKKKPGDKWFNRPLSVCKLCRTSLQELDATEQHWAGACSGMQFQGAASGRRRSCSASLRRTKRECGALGGLRRVFRVRSCLMRVWEPCNGTPTPAGARCHPPPPYALRLLQLLLLVAPSLIRPSSPTPLPSRSQVFRLHFLARPTATFADLDAELRRLWLECCGHSTQFALLRDPQPNIM